MVKNSDDRNHLSVAVRDTTRLFILGSVAYVLSYITRIILARYMSLEEFGLFFSMFSIILFLTIFRNLGLQIATVKYVSEGVAKKDLSQIKTVVMSFLFFQFLFSAILITVFFFLAEPLATHYFKTELSLWPFRLFLLYLLASPLYIAAKSTLQGLQDLKGFALADLSKNFFTLAITALFLFFGLSTLAPVYAYSIGSILSFLVLIIPLVKHRKFLKYRIKNFAGITKKMFSFGLPVMFVGFGEVVIAYLDILLLTYLTTLPEVGIYNAVLPTAMVFLFFGRAITGVLFPTAARLWGEGKKKKMAAGLYLIHRYLFALILPFVLTAFIYANQILRIFFGTEFAAGTLAFRIILIGAIFYIVAQVNNSVISATGKPKVAAKIIGIIALINVALNLILIPIFRINGAAIATSVSYALALLLSSFGVIRIVNAKIPISKWIRTFFSGGIFLAVAFAMNSVLPPNIFLKILVSIPTATLVYVLTLFLLKVVELREIKSITRQVFAK